MININWEKREWEGPEQYTDPSGKLMMLPTDMALVEDASFAKYVKLYANDENEFFKDFAAAFGKLIALGTKDVEEVETSSEEESEATKTFREMAMHGNLIRMKEIKGKPDVNAPEPYTKRTALHKASYFGHAHVVQHVLSLGGDVSVKDVDGDTPLHDAVRLGHVEVAELLLDHGAKVSEKNLKGISPVDMAKGNDECLAVLKKGKCLF